MVRYKVGTGTTVEKNVYLNRTFTISGLNPKTWIREFFVYAVNGAGPGEEYRVPDIATARLPRENNIIITSLFIKHL